MIKQIVEADHGEDDGANEALEAADQTLQGLRARLQEVEGVIGWGKAVLDETEGQARKLAFKYGWPGEEVENREGQR